MLVKNTDKKLSLAIVWFFVLQDFNALIKTIMPAQSIISSSSSILVGLIIIAIFSSNLLSILRTKIVKKSFLLFLVIYLLTIAYAAFRNEPFGVIIKESALWTFAFWIPIGVFAYCIEDKRTLLNDFYRFSFIRSALMLAVFFWFVFAGHNETDKDYNMYFSYSLVVPLLLHLDKQFSKGSAMLLLLVLLEFLAIIMYGSRGALLCILSYFVFRLVVFSSPKQRIKNIFYLLLGVGVVYFLLGHLSMAENFGLHSRILEKAEAGETLSGRDYIWLEGVALIKEYPLLGLGIGGEFYQMSVNSFNHLYYLYKDTLVISSTTPHNGFLELMLCFGIPLGIIVSFYILGKISVIKYINDNSIKSFVVVLFSVYIIPAFTVGDGIFVKPGIALFLYLALSLKNNYNRRRNIYEYRKCQTKGSQQQLVGA